MIREFVDLQRLDDCVSFGADFSIGPNMEVYGAHGVTGLFAEGGPNLAEDMGALKSWMLSKMAWDVSLATDWEKLMSEFLDGCASNAPTPDRQTVC